MPSMFPSLSCPSKLNSPRKVTEPVISTSLWILLLLSCAGVIIGSVVCTFFPGVAEHLFQPAEPSKLPTAPHRLPLFNRRISNPGDDLEAALLFLIAWPPDWRISCREK